MIKKENKKNNINEVKMSSINLYKIDDAKVDLFKTTLHLYKHNHLPDVLQINSVAIWLILERKRHIEENGTPNINSLEMLMLKNKLDQWKKEVRLQGLKPIIYINYKD